MRCFGTPRQWPSTPFAFPTTSEEEQVWIAAERRVDLELPASGTVCEQDRVPFASP